MKQVLAALAMVLMLGQAGPSAVAQTSAPRPLPEVTDELREATRLRCEKLIAERRMESQALLNVGFGAVLGAGIGAVVGSFMGLTAWGAGLGSIYGGVVGHFSGEQATIALEQRMMEFCLRGTMR